MTNRRVLPHNAPARRSTGRIRHSGRARCVACLLAAAALLLGVAHMSAAQIFTQDQLIEDARQLAQIIETSHPDPFLRCGGRIEFYRIFHGILNSIPEEGATKDEFVHLIRPLVASVGDAHTEIWTSYDTNRLYPGGVPLRFGVVGTSLYVRAVSAAQDERLLGARLVSLEGRTLPELMTKQRTLVGLENDYDVLQRLADETLWYEPYLEELLPDWADHERITVGLLLATGEAESVTFELPRLTLRMRSSPTAIEIPEANDAGFYAGFVELPAQTGVAPADNSNEPNACGGFGYIRIDHQAGFREFLEENAVAGANDTTPEQRAQVPSATEDFRELAIAMNEAETQTLVIDLRFDVGGTDTMADILVYFLYGWEGLRAYLGERYVAGGFSAMRYSELHFENCSNQTIESVNEGAAGVPFAVGEYDFSFPTGTEDSRRAEAAAVDIRSYVQERYVGATTFHEEVISGEYAAYYTPPNVVVLVSPKTFSAGSTTMRALDSAGATLFGTPSGQSMRAFGNGTLWELDHTRVQGIIARTYFDPYPNDPARGEVWPIAVPLTYEYLASTGFDPNAEILLALDWLGGQRSAPEEEAE